MQTLLENIPLFPLLIFLAINDDLPEGDSFERLEQVRKATCGNIHIWYILLLLRERSWTFYIPALQLYTIRNEKTSLFIMTTDSEGGVNAGKVRYSAGSQT